MTETRKAGPETTLESAFQQVGDLVATFKANEDRYLSPDYQEAAVRKDFIDKFFIALGWDVNHDKQKNPYEQEVDIERSASSAVKGRPDYVFYLAPNYHKVRFFVEAKKPHIDIRTKENYFQTIRYGWSSDTPLAVLTDFAQFHVLDCRAKPDIENVLSRWRQKYHYLDYTNMEKFKNLYYLFSREAVANDSLEKYAETLPTPRGGAKMRKLFPMGVQQSIDESFLAELDEHRKKLAQAFKNKNSKLDSETLTEIVQRTLDRLVFLRFLEDKGIEPARIVEEFGKSDDAWEDFVAASRRLDVIYNGIVYKHHDILDSQDFHTDEKAFADICEELAHINSPYDFNAIPIHILGSIYERFLGKVIVATDKRANVEEKLEVRKAGGVYYTPEYIVRYIVENTVGKLIAKKTPDQIAEMRFADISCGSGSFLLAIFDFLIKYHGRFYNENPSKARKGDCVSRDGKLYLSLGKKREILLNNIYGVDIDAQAVEVCQLSLYLRLLQEETEASTKQYLLDYQHIAKMKKLLPNLSKNIVCGNSLIGTDILDGQLFAGDEERKLNPINFADIFPEVMKRGGFDAVVGNPPYIRIQTMKVVSPESVNYLAKHYRAAERGNYDIYVVFVDRALSLLNPYGNVGYILPNKFFNSQYGSALRELLAKGKHVSQIVHFDAQQVFDGATTYTCLLFLDKAVSEYCRFIKVSDLKSWQKGNCIEQGNILSDRFTKGEWIFTVGQHAALCDRLGNMQKKLGDVADIFVGLQTSADDVFILDLIEEKHKMLRLRSKILGAECTLEKGLLFPLVSGTDVHGYAELPRRQYIIFPYAVTNEHAELIDFSVISKSYPKLAAYLIENKKRLSQRERGKFNDPYWYRFGRNQNLGIQSRVKICVPRLVAKLHAAWDVDGDHFLDNVDVGGITLKPEFQSQSLPYLLALLNSRLMAWYFPFVSAPFRGGWFSANRQFLSQLPFRLLNLSDSADKKSQDEIVQMVEHMLKAKNQLLKAQTDKNKDYYGKMCTSLNRQIDRIVYYLYGLTKEEIEIVEKSNADANTKQTSRKRSEPDLKY